MPFVHATSWRPARKYLRAVVDGNRTLGVSCLPALAAFDRTFACGARQDLSREDEYIP